LEDADFGSNIELSDVALSNTVGRSPFYDYGSACNSLTSRDLESLQLVRSYDVEVTTLDAWCECRGIDHIDFLKIDVEGYDLAVLEGACRLLSAQAIDAFSFEYASGWIASGRFLGEADRYVKDMGYGLFKLFPDFLAPFTYGLAHETFHGAMFVGLSPSMQARSTIPTQHVAGV
jgi:FkbM family methyltransferase